MLLRKNKAVIVVGDINSGSTTTTLKMLDEVATGNKVIQPRRSLILDSHSKLPDFYFQDNPHRSIQQVKLPDINNFQAPEMRRLNYSIGKPYRNETTIALKYVLETYRDGVLVFEPGPDMGLTNQIVRALVSRTHFNVDYAINYDSFVFSRSILYSVDFIRVHNTNPDKIDDLNLYDEFKEIFIISKSLANFSSDLRLEHEPYLHIDLEQRKIIVENSITQEHIMVILIDYAYLYLFKSLRPSSKKIRDVANDLKQKYFL